MSIIRSDITAKVPINTIALELGVGEGNFTEQLILQHKFLHVYSIDSWDNRKCAFDENLKHDEEEYKKALTRLDIYKDRNSIMRMPFESAVDIFPDGYFDFIHIDGDPLTGENEGKTLELWLPKVKENGIISGNNYHSAYPQMVSAVDTFVKNHNFIMHIHDYADKDEKHSRYPCWYVKLNEVKEEEKADEKAVPTATPTPEFTFDVKPVDLEV